MIDFTHEYSRKAWRIFLEDTFLPDDFRIAESDITYSAKYTQHVSKLGECPSLGLSVFEMTHNSVHDARVGLSKEAFKLVCDCTMQNRALILFVPQDTNARYRFSLVEFTPAVDETGKVSRKYLNPRRYSYMLGEDCKKHTPEQMLVTKGRVSSPEDLMSRFAIDVVTKEFYQQLFRWYEWALTLALFPEGVNKQARLTDKDIEMHLIRLITRLVFVWFIKQKQLVPDWLFDKEYLTNEVLKEFVPHDETSGNYYNAILQNLFFATLNKEWGTRGFAKDTTQYGDREFGIKTYYRDNNGKSYFKKTAEEIQALFECIPFLNGGLFECLDILRANKTKPGASVQEYHDGFSRVAKCRAFVPNSLFFGDGEREGIIGLFSRYNFTVEENTPVDIDVALDPELLGKVFENLLGYYNEESRTTARKESGSFYTPREIVDYMVAESLKAYLLTQSDIAKDGAEAAIIDALFSYTEDMPDMSESERKTLVKKIDECSILDPACGSGAFPMGVLNKLSHALSKLDPDGSLWAERQKERAIKAADEAFAIQSPMNREARLKEISDIFETNKTEYGHKLYLIENCLFGVDIQPIAIQISKLRFFISLIVEQERDENKYNFGIRPLPNLETKFVAANTLIGLGAENKELLNLEDENLAVMKNELWNIRRLHFYAVNAKDKRNLRELDKLKRAEIKEYLFTHAARPNTTLLAHNGIEIARLTIERKEFENERLVDVSRENNHLFEQLNNELPQYIDANAVKRGKIDAEINRMHCENEKELRKADNTTIAGDIERIAGWDPYDQNAQAALFFDPDWMFGSRVKGGFDVVIGNPPYVQVPRGIFSKEQFPYSEGKDKGKQNLYKVFVENSFNLAKGNSGIATMIVQSSLMADLSSQYTRELLLTKTQIREIIEFPKKSQNRDGQVFKTVLQGTCIYQFKKKIPEKDVSFNVSIGNDITTIKNLEYETLQQDELIKFYPNGYFIPLVRSNEFQVIRKIWGTSFPLMNIIIEQSQGDFNLSTEKEQYSTILTNIKLLRGDHIHRYYINYDVNEFVNNNFLQTKINKNLTNRYLVRQQITGTTDRQRLHFALSNTEEKFLCGHSVGKILIEETRQRFILGILNSKLLDWYFRKTSTNNNVNGYEIEQMPIPNNYSQPAIEKLAEYMEFLRDNINPAVSDMISNEVISYTIENVIDACVHELYFEDEIKSAKTDILFLLGSFLKNIATSPIEKQINQLFMELNEYKGEIRNRIILQETRSESVAQIIKSTSW